MPVEDREDSDNTVETEESHYKVEQLESKNSKEVQTQTNEDSLTSQTDSNQDELTSQTDSTDSRVNKKEDEYASGIEWFIATILAPELLTDQGRVTILTIWSLMAACAVFGATQVETNFSMTYFIPPDSGCAKYMDFDFTYFKTGFNLEVQVVNPDIDYASEEV